MIATYPPRSWFRARRFAVSLLLVLLPACGVSEYEALMQKTQEREQRFRDEKKYLDEPIKIPTRKEKDTEVPLANAFFRPPKGILPTFQTEPIDNLLWRYLARGGDFARVEIAFAADNKDFASDVFRNYRATAQARARAQEFTPAGRAPMIFDIWEFDEGQESYSINILRGGKTQVAIVYVYGRGRGDNLRKAMDLSLESLAVDQEAGAARQKFSRKSPWQLQANRAP